MFMVRFILWVVFVINCLAGASDLFVYKSSQRPVIYGIRYGFLTPWNLIFIYLTTTLVRCAACLLRASLADIFAGQVYERHRQTVNSLYAVGLASALIGACAPACRMLDPARS